MVTHILVIGSLNMDMEVDVDRFPQPGETIISRNFSMSFGGKGANQAVAAARLGGKVSMLGAVGDDEYGTQILANLARNNIDHTLVKTQKGHSSGKAIITRSRGQNTIMVIPGANHSITEHDLDAASVLVEQVDVLLIQYELPKEVIIKAIHLGHHYNKTVIVNPAPMLSLPQEIRQQVSYFIPNEHEIFSLAQYHTQTPEEIILSCSARIIMTYGEKGVLYSPDQKQIDQLPAPKVNTIDTTGAGDCFCGAFSVFQKTYPLDQAIERAIQASALAVTKAGAQSAMPYLDELAFD